MKKLNVLLMVILGAVVMIFSTGCPQVKEIFDPPPNTATGDTLWIHETAGTDSLAMLYTLALGHNGYIYYAVAGGTIHWTPARIRALDPSNGNMVWESERMDHIGMGSEIMVGDDGTVYAVGFHKLYAFDGNTGVTKWVWEVPETLPNPDNPGQDVYTKGALGHIALTDDGNILAGTSGSGSYNRSIFLINQFGDKVFHNLKANGWGVEGPFAIGKNNMAFYYSRDINANNQGMRLVALDLATGNVAWTLEIFNHYSGANNIAIGDDGNLVTVFNDINKTGKKAHLIDAGSGNILWTSPFEVEAVPKFIGPDGTVYEELFGHKYSVYGSTRDLVMDTPFPAGINVGAIGNNNKLLTGFTDSGRLRHMAAYSPSGNQEWSTRMDGLVGKKFVVSNDHVIYGIINLHPASFIPTKICAIQGNTSLASSGWPSFAHDNQNTSNVNK
jgi:outer membrane protein assembly factor BamB